MPNISKIKLPNENTSRELKDTTARAVFTPATSSASGTQGQVPAPTYAEVTAGKFLKADGTWDTPAGGTAPTGDDILLTGYTQGSDTTAVVATDKVNEAIAKHENKIALNQTNISSVEDMICDTEFSTSTAYAVGDIVTYEHRLYKFNTAHSAGVWNSAEVDQVDVTDLVNSGGGGSVESITIGGSSTTAYTPDANGNIDLPAYPTVTTYSGNAPISVSGSTISHSTSAGYKHLPSGGSTGQFLQYGGSSGTGNWSALPYGSESAQGAVRVWVTTVGSDTVLHISNQAAT